MIDVRFVPLKEWPGKPTVGRVNGRFRASYAKTLDLLEEELTKLRAKNVLIQAWFTMQQLRNDGWPYANAVPSGPGVVLSFDTPKGSLSFPCDTYFTYDDNLRAIGLALEVLRTVAEGERGSGEKETFPEVPAVRRRIKQAFHWAMLSSCPYSFNEDAFVESFLKTFEEELAYTELVEALESVLSHLPQGVISHTIWEDDDGTIIYYDWYMKARAVLAKIAVKEEKHEAQNDKG